jgi:hypothetical protein
MRIDEVIENNKKMQKNYRINTEEGRQAAILSVLTDISETLAIMVDLYGIVHGRIVSSNGDEKNAELQ